MSKDQELLYLILLSPHPFFIDMETIFILWLLNGTSGDHLACKYRVRLLLYHRLFSVVDSKAQTHGAME